MTGFIGITAKTAVRRQNERNYLEMENEKETKSANVSALEQLGAASAGPIQCLTIIGQIEGHYLQNDNAKTTRYEHLIPLLCSIEENAEIAGVLILLNTIGGDVEAGLAIAELIASMTKPTVSLVLGGGHSIGVPLAVSAKRSFIVPSATMTLHPVRTSGLVLGVPQSFESLRRMQERIDGFILRSSRIEPSALSRLMTRTDEIATDVGSVIDGKEAVRLGLIDEVGGLSEALAALKAMAEEEKRDLSSLSGAAGQPGSEKSPVKPAPAKTSPSEKSVSDRSDG